MFLIQELDLGVAKSSVGYMVVGDSQGPGLKDPRVSPMSLVGSPDA